MPTPSATAVCRPSEAMANPIAAAPSPTARPRAPSSASEVIEPDVMCPTVPRSCATAYSMPRNAPASASATTATPASRLPSLVRSEEHTSELQSLRHLVCRLLLEKKKKKKQIHDSI